MKNRVKAALFVLSLGLILSCGAKTTETLGGESHFLSRCNEACAEGLSCIEGVCTVKCDAETTCTPWSSSATCTDGAGFSTEVCDVACTSDVDCSSLTGTHSCSDGYCRAAFGGTKTEGDCEADGVWYEAGESFQCDCNTCTCMEDGTFLSTAIACAGPVPGDLGCTEQGSRYPYGSMWSCDDGCSLCTCATAGVERQSNGLCTDEAEGCVLGTEVYAVGQSWACDCNTCTCLEDGAIGTTMVDCAPPSEEETPVEPEVTPEPDAVPVPTDDSVFFVEWETCADGACMCAALENCSPAFFHEALPLGSHAIRTCEALSDGSTCRFQFFQETEGGGTGYSCEFDENSTCTDDLAALQDFCTQTYNCNLLLDDCPSPPAACDTPMGATGVQ